MALNDLQSDSPQRIVAFAGGVGGAKFADGLMRCLPPGSLTVVVNTGDDFTHYGLSISPDLDTVLYTLGGLADPVKGWGIADDTREMLSMMQRFGDEAWFSLGDRDVATHLLRTQALAQGKTLSDVTTWFATQLNIPARIVPMSNDRVATIVETVDYGTLAFQEYFVRYRWQPVVSRLHYEGAEHARPSPGLLEIIEQATGIVICPSNPLLSIEPILQIPGIRTALECHRVPCVAISPIIAGQAVKGPAAKLMGELGLDPSVAGITAYYGDLIDGLVIDEADRNTQLDQDVLVTDAWMRSIEDRVRLAKEVINWMELLK